MKGFYIEDVCVTQHSSNAKFLKMATGKKTWNLCDGSLLTTKAMGDAAHKGNDSEDSSASSKRSVSTSSTSSTASVYSDSPLVHEITSSQAMGFQHLCNRFRSLNAALHGNERISTIRYYSTRDQSCHTYVRIQMPVLRIYSQHA